MSDTGLGAIESLLASGSSAGSQAQFSELLQLLTQIVVSLKGGSPIPSSNITGTTTNDNAAAGILGEFISSTVLAGAGVSLITGTPKDITSIILTAGDWDVEGTVAINPAGSTTLAEIVGWISAVSATLPTAPNNGAEAMISGSLTTGAPQIFPTGKTRISLAAPATIHLSCQASFGVSTCAAYGFIGARRAR